MNIAVLVKCVPDTETRIKIAPDGASIDESDIKWIVNPFDEYALEEALRQVEAAGAGEVTVVCVGDERAQAALRQCLAVGAHRAVLLSADEFRGSDGIAAARALAAAIGKLEPELVLAGKQGVGDDRSQVGVMVAELVDWAHVGVVTKLELADGKATCWREIEGGQEVVEASLPCVVTAQKGLNEPRYAKLKGIMAAKKKPIDSWSPAELGLDPAVLGAAGAAERWTKLELPPPRPASTMLEGDPKQVAEELVRLLSEQSKVI